LALQNTVRAAYNRAEYLVERRAMMNRWADRLDEMTANLGLIIQDLAPFSSFKSNRFPARL
jgi:hypothetical protein